jgi:hypothetical protein
MLGVFARMGRGDWERSFSSLILPQGTLEGVCGHHGLGGREGIEEVTGRGWRSSELAGGEGTKVAKIGSHCELGWKGGDWGGELGRFGGHLRI